MRADMMAFLKKTKETIEEGAKEIEALDGLPPDDRLVKLNEILSRVQGTIGELHTRFRSENSKK